MLNLYPQAELVFVGNVDGFERPLVALSGVPFAHQAEVQAGPLHGVNPIQAIKSLYKLGVGTVMAFRLLRRRKPQAILSTGGWVSVPVAVAARLLGVPMLIYLPDIEPGLTIKVLRLFAQKVAVTVAESQRYFRAGQTVVTGYPLRGAIFTATRPAGQAHFGLDADRKTLLVFGGSRGARAINILIGDHLAALLEAGVQVIHITGTLDWERTQAQIGDLATHPDYHGFAYLHDEMALAFAASDLVVARAGASVLGEFPVFELPSVLIPLAYSWRYQQVNADYLAERGAAVHLDEAAAAAELLPLLKALLIQNPPRLLAMRSCAAALVQPDGAANVARVLAQLAQGDR